MSGVKWGVRHAIAAYALLALVSGVASVAVLVSLDAPMDDVDLGDPTILIGVILSTVVGMGAALGYALRHAGKSAFRWGPLELESAVIAVGAVVPVLGFGYGWTLVIEALGYEALPQSIVDGMLATPSMPALLFACGYGIIGAAVFEEMLFRGFIQPAMVARFKVFTGILLTSILFGLIHASDPWAVVPTMVISGVAGWLRERTGGLGAPILFHAANNFTALILTVAAV